MNKLTRLSSAALLLPFGLSGGALAQQSGEMTFFVTSMGSGNGADLGGRRRPALPGAGGRGRRRRTHLARLPQHADERGEVVKGGGDTPNMHDIFTGSQPDGTAFDGPEDRTCSNWASSGEGAAMVGHHDRQGQRDDAPSGRAATGAPQQRACNCHLP